MFGRIFRYPSQMRFHYMISVQIRHFSIRFDPDLSDQACIESHIGQQPKSKSRTLYFANFANQSKAVMCNLNFPLLLNLPKHVPNEIKFGLAIEIAFRIKGSDT